MCIYSINIYEYTDKQRWKQTNKQKQNAHNHILHING